MSKEELEELAEEIEFLSGKTGIPKSEVVELVKVHLLNEIGRSFDEQE
ncbi:hypothetical protein [Eisenbergiella tayi]|nr:hypothetical protein [Eisenbergiella tayi]